VRAPSGRTNALRRLTTITVFGLFPLSTLVAMLLVSRSDDSIAADFHHEIYPQAELMLGGGDPYPRPDFDPTAAANFIWPPLDAYLLAPLTVLPSGAADVVMVLFGLGCFALALWVLEVRDWRVYGVFALWPEVAGEMRVSHLTPQLCLCLALAWRYRGTRFVPGLLVGLSISLKFFVWPVVAWLLATRRFREALVAVGFAGASLLLLIPYGLVDYLRALLQLGEAFDQDSYSLFGLLTQGGFSDGVARGATWTIGCALLVTAFRYRSFTLAVATALALSPIAWLDYFALAGIPLAVTRPRLSWIWFVPLATWGLEGAGLGIGDTPGTLRLMLAFGIVVAVAFADELRQRRGQLDPRLDDRSLRAHPRAGGRRLGTP